MTEISSYTLMREKFPKQPEEIRTRLKEMKKYIQDLSVLGVCFHGIAQSGALVDVLEDKKMFGPGLKVDNTGVDLLTRQVGLVSLHSWPVERRKEFMSELADVLSSAQKIALFVEGDRISGQYQKEILQALLQAAQDKGLSVYQVSKPDEYKRLITDLQREYPA